jgi:hypothetical protein
VLGARAGHERYVQIMRKANDLMTTPQARRVAAAVSDPELRRQVLDAVSRLARRFREGRSVQTDARSSRAETVEAPGSRV